MGAELRYRVYRPMHGPDRSVYPVTGMALHGFTSSLTRTANRFGVPAGAFYDVLDVAVLNPDVTDTFIDPADGYVHFTLRTEETPVMPVTGNYNSTTPYRVLSRDATLAQTSRAFTEIELPAAYNGKRVVTRYDTNAGFNAVNRYVTDAFERVAASSPLVRAMHPVYLSFSVRYSLRVGSSILDTASLTEGVVRFINDFDPRQVIDVSDIITFIRNSSLTIDTVYPFTIDYQLLAPDGTTVEYSTDDRVIMHESKLVDTGIVRSAAELLRMGVSDRTTRFVTSVDSVTVTDIDLGVR
jgi:hypothetical protein